MMDERDKRFPTKPAGGDVSAFLRKVASTPARKHTGEKGRLMFAMDATASRAPTWDRASHLQAEMFHEAASLGGLSIQLAYFRGYGEFHSTPWLADSAQLLREMTGVTCLSGMTQIERVLGHAVAETRHKRIQALVYVGDCMEETPERLLELAGQLGVLGVPAFIFHEGADPVAEQTFRQIAERSHGAYCRFDSTSAQHLRELLSAVAVYAAGGRKALESYSERKGGLARQVALQLPKPRSNP